MPVDLLGHGSTRTADTRAEALGPGAWGSEDPCGDRGVQWNVNFQTTYKGWKMIRELLVATAISAAAIGVAPTASADPIDQLRGMLPAGYGPDSCHPIEDQLATHLECGQNSMPGGPANAGYLLFRNLGDLRKSYDVALKSPTRQIVPCEEGGPAAAIRWNNAKDGWLFCGLGGGDAEVIWNKESSLFAAHTDGSDLSSLVQWWKNTGYQAG